MDCDIHIHLLAAHDRPGFETAIPGAGLLCPFDADKTLAVGMYRNSIAKHSAYAALAWQPWRIGPVKIGLFGGVVTGYLAHPTPFAAAALSIPEGGRVWHVIVMPKTPTNPTTAALSVSWKF